MKTMHPRLALSLRLAALSASSLLATSCAVPKPRMPDLPEIPKLHHGAELKQQVRGVVIDTRTDAPVADARVTVTYQRSTEKAITGPNGKFSLPADTAPAPGTATPTTPERVKTVQITKPGYRTSTYRYAAQGITPGNKKFSLTFEQGNTAD